MSYLVVLVSYIASVLPRQILVSGGVLLVVYSLPPTDIVREAWRKFVPSIQAICVRTGAFGSARKGYCFPAYFTRYGVIPVPIFWDLENSITSAGFVRFLLVRGVP